MRLILAAVNDLRLDDDKRNTVTKNKVLMRRTLTTRNSLSKVPLRMKIGIQEKPLTVITVLKL